MGAAAAQVEERRGAASGVVGFVVGAVAATVPTVATAVGRGAVEPAHCEEGARLVFPFAFPFRLIYLVIFADNRWSFYPLPLPLVRRIGSRK